jgi:hypothetical protein
MKQDPNPDPPQKLKKKCLNQQQDVGGSKTLPPIEMRTGKKGKKNHIEWIETAAPSCT